MRREDLRDLEAERLRRLRDRDRDDDYGQADYSNLYGYDPRTRSRLPRPMTTGRGPPARDATGRPRAACRPPSARRDGPSDRRPVGGRSWRRLHDERRLDLREVEVEVHDGEVTLNGVVRHKADKRRIEDIADIDGVRNVQNNLQARERSRLDVPLGLRASPQRTAKPAPLSPGGAMARPGGAQVG